MTESTNRRLHDMVVVIGVDGSPASVNAVRYGVKEAQRLAARVRLVHVLPEYESFGSPVHVPVEELRANGRVVVADVLAKAGDLPGDVEIETVLRRGTRIGTLNAIARTAQALVVGADTKSIASRLLTGNVTTGVAASSPTPVVSVPETWSGDGQPAAPVLVGVKNAAHARELLGVAFDLAETRGQRLVILHAWRLPLGYDDVIADRVSTAEWESWSRKEMQRLAAEWQGVHPDVAVEFRVVHDQPAHALVEASRTAGELVLVRRAHGIPAATHLGSTARAVLRATQCPVRVVPPGYVTDGPNLSLEEEGAALK